MLVTVALPDIALIHINVIGTVDTFGSKWHIPFLGICQFLYQ
ncbi:hypothetical protein [Methanobrevibacter cuticularis]|nr:hypothetical protein [Methanobrevibacter cuticularis]